MHLTLRRRHLPWWRVVVATLLVAVVAGACTGTMFSSQRTVAAKDPGPAAVDGWHVPGLLTEEPRYEFVAAPDFLNQDVGDLRTLPTWRPGDPNSWTPQLQQGIRRFLDEIASLNPGSVLVAGDLVEGRWGRDAGGTGIFGPVRTQAQQRAAVRRAADFYYSAYVHRFAERGLTLHAALGDHDIGDNPWDDQTPWTTFKRRNLALFKQLWAQHFTEEPSGAPRYADRPVGTIWEHTAYAVRLSPDVLLVSLDEFHRRDGDVHFEVQGGQLRWLRRTLQQAQRDDIPWVVVQGHNPVLMPVREESSSGNHVEGGERSALWQTMARYGVDLYLNGEVHATTMRQADGVTQISTGGLLYHGEATYLVARVFDDRIDFDVRQFSADRRAGRLWQTTGMRTAANPGYSDEPSHSIGSMSLTSDGRAVDQAGMLEDYRVP